MMRTAYQVVMGLAGLFYVTDPEEALAVPGADTGANDIPVILQDRCFDSNNQFLYQPNMMWGYLADRILVNGKPNAVFSLEPRAYRLRVLNGSNARTYKLAWSNGMALKVIGTDGGLLPAAVSKSYVMLMPGERVDLWVDFSALAGKQVILRSLAFTAGGGMMGGGGGGMGGGGMGGGGMGGGGMVGSSLANGAAFNILTVNVGRKASDQTRAWVRCPRCLRRYNAANVTNFNTPVPFTLGMQMMTWTINGRVYEMMVARRTMKWCTATFRSPGNGSTTPPSRTPCTSTTSSSRWSSAPPRPPAATAPSTRALSTAAGKIPSSVWPGERVKIAMRFGPDTGMYMYHCHILEHEDMGMMRNLMVMEPMMGM